MADGTTAGGYVRDVVEKVTPSVLAARAAGRTEDADFIAEHIRHTVDLLLERSRTLADAVEAGRVAVVGLSYRLADGTAPWSPPGASTYPSARWRDPAVQRSLRSGTTLRSWSALIAPARRSTGAVPVMSTIEDGTAAGVGPAAR